MYESVKLSPIRAAAPPSPREDSTGFRDEVSLVKSAHPLDPPTATAIEAASWTLAAEMTRRHPELTITRYHPGGGQYDCLAIRSERGVAPLVRRKVLAIHQVLVHADRAVHLAAAAEEAAEGELQDRKSVV